MGNNTKLSIAFRMFGDSMDGGGKRGFIDGDILNCDKVDIQSIKSGECYVITSRGGATVMKVVEFDGERIIASPLNPSYSELEFAVNEVQGVYLVKSYQRKVAEDIDL